MTTLQPTPQKEIAPNVQETPRYAVLEGFAEPVQVPKQKKSRKFFWISLIVVALVGLAVFVAAILSEPFMGC